MNEDTVQRLLTQAYRDLGYEVITFRDGSRGVTRSRCPAKTINLMNRFATLVLDAAEKEGAGACEKHGAEGCIECEKRCVGCGDDGDMTERHGERVCENCAWAHDHGEDDCGSECSEIPEPLRRLHRTHGKCGTHCPNAKRRRALVTGGEAPKGGRT